MKLVFRLISLTYIVLFVVYFYMRAMHSLGNVNLVWRIFVLIVEFLSSMSVVFVVALRLREPWTSFVGQLDGIEMIGTLQDTYKKHLKKSIKLSHPTSDIADVDASDEDLDADPTTPLVEKTSQLDQQTKQIELTTFPDGPCALASGPIHAGDADPQALHIENERVKSIGKVASAHENEEYQVNPNGYIIRCLVPCYREDLEIVKSTCLAALHMDYKYRGTNLFVYILDDGQDSEKKSWVEKMQVEEEFGKRIFYISRPERFRGHGKSGNLNYALREVIFRHAYYTKTHVSRRELVAVFDADMVATSQFLNRSIPYFKGDNRCVMVQTPQTFHNVPKEADYFDAHNINFFQYLLPSMSETNTTTCCGTNFLVSAAAMNKVGFFPTISVTEDMYLAIVLLSKGGNIHYHAENLVVGEAPQDLRQIFQQRSRWAKGTIQIFFKDNPLFKSGLSWLQRLAFFNAAWSYFTSAFMNPLFVIINAVGILFGLFPVTDLSFVTAMVFIMYYVVFFVTIHFTPVPGKHFTSLWVVGKMGHFFSFMALKAIFNVVKGFVLSKAINFKVTEKKQMANGRKLKDMDNPDAQEHESVSSNRKDNNQDFPPADKESSIVKEYLESRDSSHRDIVFHWVMSIAIVLTVLYGIYDIFTGNSILEVFSDERGVNQKKGIRLFMCFWMIQFFIAYSLPLWYAYLPQSFDVQAKALRVLSIVDTFVSFALILLTIALFKMGILTGLPSVDSITSVPASMSPLWLNSPLNHMDVGTYIYDSAVNDSIPVIVVNERPNRGFSFMEETDSIQAWQEYKNLLSGLSNTIKEKSYPVVVVFEPNWMEDLMTVTDDPDADGVYVALTEGYLAWDIQGWYRVLDAFSSFLEDLGNSEDYYVYIDAGNIHYHESVEGHAMKRMNASLDHSLFRGISLNVGHYFASQDNARFGIQTYVEYGLRFIEDSSRNGGDFSRNSKFSDIAECRYDPPRVKAGLVPQWNNGSDIWDMGMDGQIWGRKLGESDGRLYEFGEFRTCLLDHSIECNAACPAIPQYYQFDWYRPAECECQ